jgi:hypothetical protein
MKQVICRLVALFITIGVAMPTITLPGAGSAAAQADPSLGVIETIRRPWARPSRR